MILISSREKFWEADHLADEDQIRDVPSLDDFSLGDVKSEQWLQGELKNKTILILIHGYNSEADDTIRAYKMIESKAKRLHNNHYDHVLGYLWPGGNNFWNYKAAKDRSSAVGFRVLYWLKLVSSFGTTVDIMTHSMGGRVTYYVRCEIGRAKPFEIFLRPRQLSITSPLKTATTIISRPKLVRCSTYFIRRMILF